MTRPQIQELHDIMIRHLVVIDGLVSKMPKHHLWQHLTDQISFLGNPVMYDTWQDEGANRWLKKALGGLHAAAFEEKAFPRVAALLRKREKRET